MLKTREALILAGGRGTRLGSLTENTPKPLLKVGNRPFLFYQLETLAKQGIEKVVLSIGYKAEAFRALLQTPYPKMEIILCEEKETLGTGGAIRFTMDRIQGEDFFALNGDTFFPIDLKKLEDTHFKHRADITFALKEMENFERYGTVEVKEDRIMKFLEKQPRKKGLINGGVYLIHKPTMETEPANKNFSFEKDFVEKKVEKLKLYSELFSDYFIDLGVPEDFAKAQKDSLTW